MQQVEKNERRQPCNSGGHETHGDIRKCINTLMNINVEKIPGFSGLEAQGKCGHSAQDQAHHRNGGTGSTVLAGGGSGSSSGFSARVRA